MFAIAKRNAPLLDGSSAAERVSVLGLRQRDYQRPGASAQAPWPMNARRAVPAFESQIRDQPLQRVASGYRKQRRSLRVSALALSDVEHTLFGLEPVVFNPSAVKSCTAPSIPCLGCSESQYC